jgi:hypothetical protein
VRRGKNEDSRYGIVDREDRQRYNKCLAWGPYEAERTLVLGTIHSNGVAVNRHRKGTEEEAAQKSNDGNTI